MPDPVLYLQAMIASAVVSATGMLAIGWARRPANPARVKVAAIIGIALGLWSGYRVLHLRLSWPPVNGLDRLLTVVLPMVMGIELAASNRRVSSGLAWPLRLSLAAVMGRILLHGSVYLGDSSTAWTTGRQFAALALSGTVMAVVWGLLNGLSRRSPGTSIPLSLALATQSAGLTVMLAGYVTGGASALPLVAGLVATSIISMLFNCREAAEGTIGIAVVALFGLLFVGRFFGGLSTGTVLTIFLAPLLCWVTEIPLLRRQKPWVVGTLRLVLVAIPLVVVLGLAKRDFDRDTAPLLGLIPPPAPLVVDDLHTVLPVFSI